ncbi:MAG: ABC transporter substrate-binding protein [Spirochaetota bacterium]
MSLRKLITILSLAAIHFGCEKPQQSSSAITIPLKYRAEVLDPLQAVDESTVLVVNFLHRRLFAYSPDGRLEDDLAARTTLKGRSAFVTLQPGEATAEDVVYALGRVQKDANQSWVMEQIRAVRRIDGRTFEIELAASGRPAVVDWQLARIKLTLPQCAIFRADRHQATREFVPFSRYRVAEQTGDRILLASRDGTPPVEFIAMPDETARYFAFREGRLDAYEALGIHRRLAQDNDLYEPKTMYDLVVLYAGFNVAPDSALADPALRRAINLAFDRNALCKNTLLGACTGADYPIPAILSPPPAEPFPAAGNYRIPPATETVILFTLSDKERMLIAEYMRHIFKKFNIHLEFRIVDLPSMVRESNKGTRGIYLMKWSGDYPHAENFLMPLFHSRNAGVGGNRAHVRDAILDRMLDSSSYTVTETQKLQQRIRFLSPWLFIGFQNMQFFRLKTSRLQIPTIFAGWGERTIR